MRYSLAVEAQLLLAKSLRRCGLFEAFERKVSQGCEWLQDAWQVLIEASREAKTGPLALKAMESNLDSVK